MTSKELLELIGDGNYGSQIPDDDETLEALTIGIMNGLIRNEASRVDDFYWLTPKGRRKLSRAETDTR